MQKFIVLAAVLALVLVSGTAFADPDPSIVLPDLPMDDVINAASTILAGLGVIWVVRKLIKLSNRS